jgi:phosphoribosylglycinamide formyltransferase-1
VKRLAIIISGRGSNMAAILDAVDAGSIAARVVGVISDRPEAAGLQIASKHGVPTYVVDHRCFADRNQFEQALATAIDALAPDLVVLAGFMRVVSAPFVARYAGRLINIHPSLLPAYPGLGTHGRALADGVKIHGCTVHFVTEAVDHGPIIVQGAVAVHHDDTEATLAARVLATEHRVLVAAVRWFCAGDLVDARGGVGVKGVKDETTPLIVPVID